MSERFSIKGKGAELFYGSEERREPEQRPEAETPELAATQLASSPAGQPPSQPASLPPSAQATMRAHSAATAEDTSTRDRLRDQLEQDHPLHYSYRFSRQEIEALRDVAYELEAKRGLRVTKNDVIRLGLEWVIDDYHARGEDSLLMQVMTEQRRRVRR